MSATAPGEPLLAEGAHACHPTTEVTCPQVRAAEPVSVDLCMVLLKVVWGGFCPGGCHGLPKLKNGWLVVQRAPPRHKNLEEKTSDRR